VCLPKRLESESKILNISVISLEIPGIVSYIPTLDKLPPAIKGDWISMLL